MFEETSLGSLPPGSVFEQFGGLFVRGEYRGFSGGWVPCTPVGSEEPWHLRHDLVIVRDAPGKPWRVL